MQAYSCPPELPTDSSNAAAIKVTPFILPLFRLFSLVEHVVEASIKFGG